MIPFIPRRTIESMNVSARAHSRPGRQCMCSTAFNLNWCPFIPQNRILFLFERFYFVERWQSTTIRCVLWQNTQFFLFIHINLSFWFGVCAMLPHHFRTQQTNKWKKNELKFKQQNKSRAKENSRSGAFKCVCSECCVASVRLPHMRTHCRRCSYRECHLCVSFTFWLLMLLLALLLCSEMLLLYSIHSAQRIRLKIAAAMCFVIGCIFSSTCSIKNRLHNFCVLRRFVLFCFHFPVGTFSISIESYCMILRLSHSD